MGIRFICLMILAPAITPRAQPFPVLSGCCGAWAEHPTRAMVTRLRASREGSAGGSGNTTIRTLHARELPSFFLELLSWEGPSLRLPINLAA